MCSGTTKSDCYRHRVLGLPRGRLEAVSRIQHGAALFLYEFDTKHLYGPYHADSDGGVDLVPGAFRGHFPAQVKFMIDGDFMPVPESSLRSAIKENYFKGKFSPELTATQLSFLSFRISIGARRSETDFFFYERNRHDVDNWPPAPAFLPPPALPAQPPAYAHYPTAYVAPPAAHPTAYVAPPAAHLMPPEAYAPPCSSTQPTMRTYHVPTTVYGYQAGYAACDPLPSTYQYVEAPLPCSLYDLYSMSQYVLAPVYSPAPYYEHDQYQSGNVNSHYQQSTYERPTYVVGHDMDAANLQHVTYGSTPSGPTAAHGTAVTNL
ncbi:hypothetical protein PAHAL_8G193200 [Panicum hallii]|uniref:DCD domain-containing protein n=1 Tax=Panicum hallii TaxID=206008 RepID=A0A2S3IEI1_9POAL|nr:hypothetical protein PAHAL_8G193200 [Panicum hallii]